MILTTLIPELINITRAAMDEIMEVYSTFTSDDVITKADDSPLTIADTRAHNVIVAGLKKLTPEIAIISEEHKNLDYAERKNLEYIWCIDPLDGTKEFVKRNGEFCVNIALIKNNHVVLGLVGVPATGVVYHAVKGNGAFKLEDGIETKLRASNFKMTDSNLRLVASRSHLNEATQAFADKLDNAEFVSRGSALKFTIIAEGNADIYPRLAPTMEWDTASAHIILEEAGGIVVRYDNQVRLRYNKQNLLNPQFVAYGDVQK